MMAQLDVFKREREAAKKVQGATAPKPVETTPPSPVASPADISKPSLFGRATSYLADKLKPQEAMDTRPRIPGTPTYQSMVTDEIKTSPFAKAVKRGRAQAD